ncbi:MAG: hypothetical protein HUU46_14710 [Candidatus Hydrogenedentes bacterium]|nr:hypothetical protein [Candidatus Hydrogenedentota bacterium]
MGTGVLSSALNPSLFNKPFTAHFPLFGQGPLFSKTGPLDAAASGEQEDAVTSDHSNAIADQFEGIVYRSQVERLSLSLAYHEAAAKLSNDGEQTTASATAKQLTFEFLAESRTEELVRFNSRTDAVADGLSGGQRAQYLEASRLVAQRFSFSLTISGATLNSFAGASEELQQANSADGINELLKLTNEALTDSDDVLNKIFDLLDAFFNNSTDDFQTRFQELYEGLTGLGLVGSPSGTANGTARLQATSFSLQLEFSFESVEFTQVQQSDPIVLDLDGDGFEITHHNDGARFDIRGNGKAAATAFVNGGDAFLALDRNGNGLIDSGRELFGDQHGAANGFEELRKLDSNGDGVIDANDKGFDKLLVFRDNGNGKTEPGELQSLAEAGISQIDLRYANVDEHARGGNRLAQRASFSYADGRRGHAADALLNFIA